MKCNVIQSVMSTKVTFLAPAQRSERRYVFTGVCHFNSGGGGGRDGQHQRSTTCPPPDQVTIPPSLPPGPGHNTSLPPDQVTTPPSLPPGFRLQHPQDQVNNTSLPTPLEGEVGDPPLGPGHKHLPSPWTTSPFPQDQVTTPPSLSPGQHLPPPWDQATTPPSPSGTRSQHLPPSHPPGTRPQHHPPLPWTTPPPPLEPGHMTSLPPPLDNTSLPRT